MALFFIGLAILLVGYFTYGKLVEKILAPDDRQTPATAHADGVDFLVLPSWKNMLIQLLNIAGVGPVIGVIIGIKFGELVFLIIPIGNIIAGATHDFLAGMMSMRNKGANLPTIVKNHLGTSIYPVFSVFMSLLLLLVVAVFINIPANLIDGFFPSVGIFWWAVVGIFVYYILASLFPIDKIIGKVYPVFGAVLIVGSFAILAALICAGIKDPSVLAESEAFKSQMWTTENGHPIIPLLFVTIACGIISGFHGTQSPIVARTIKTERQAKGTFYGMMVLEGVIAMIWAAGALAVYNLFPEQMSQNPSLVLSKITTHFLGSSMGAITVIGVIVLAVTSGDTAMRSLRLSLAEICKVSQKKVSARVLLCIPLILIVSGLLWWSNIDAKSFNILWNYFAWGNQVLAVFTLAAGFVWLKRSGKSGAIAMIPAAFMIFIVLCYILWISPAHGGPVGFGLELNSARILAGVLTAFVLLAIVLKARKKN